jgi:WD40-like Beta Propeller Repeat
MKRLLGIAAARIEVLLLIGALWIRIQERTGRRIRSKTDQAIRQSAQLMRLGGDPNPVFHLISQIPPIVSVGQLAEAEALADRALTTVDAAIRALPAPSRITLPTDTRPEAASGLYFDPQPVVIEGYDGVAMEPFISPDGRFLFFNNSNESQADTNLYWPRGTGSITFQFLGELPGVNSPSLDAVPSMDAAGHFYFTTLRDYDRTRAVTFTGDFDGHGVNNVHPVPGNVNSGLSPGEFNMDVGISPDGHTLYISRAQMIPGAPVPKSSELLMATLENGAFTTALIDDCCPLFYCAPFLKTSSA